LPHIFHSTHVFDVEACFFSAVGERDEFGAIADERVFVCV
jgi:hypothetical protein